MKVFNEGVKSYIRNTDTIPCCVLFFYTLAVVPVAAVFSDTFMEAYD